jgi:hypothetical protein
LFLRSNWFDRVDLEMQVEPVESDVETMLEDCNAPEEFEIPNDCTERGYDIYTIMAAYDFLYNIQNARINEHDNYTYSENGTWYSSACMQTSNNDTEPPGYIPMEEQMVTITMRYDSDSDSDSEESPYYFGQSRAGTPYDPEPVIDNPLNWDMGTPSTCEDDSEWNAAGRLIFDIETHPGPCVPESSFYVGLASLQVWDRSTFVDREIINGFCQDYPCYTDYTTIVYPVDPITPVQWFYLFFPILWCFIPFLFSWIDRSILRIGLHHGLFWLRVL